MVVIFSHRNPTSLHFWQGKETTITNTENWRIGKCCYFFKIQCVVFDLVWNKRVFTSLFIRKSRHTAKLTQLTQFRIDYYYGLCFGLKLRFDFPHSFLIVSTQLSEFSCAYVWIQNQILLYFCWPVTSTWKILKSIKKAWRSLCYPN